MAERIHHVSETAAIVRFEPRADAEGRLRVWAIGESRLHNYLLPRDCPRVTYYTTATTSERDRRAFFTVSDTQSVVAIEHRWLQALSSTRLHVYEFDAGDFVLEDEIAAYYVSTARLSRCASRGREPTGGVVRARRRAARVVVVVAAARRGGGIDARLFHHTNAQCPTARRTRGRRLTTDRLLRPASSNARYRGPYTRGFPADTRVRPCMSVPRWLSSKRDRTVHCTWPFPSCRPVPLPEQWQCLPIDGRCAATCWNTCQRRAFRRSPRSVIRRVAPSQSRPWSCR